VLNDFGKDLELNRGFSATAIRETPLKGRVKDVPRSLLPIKDLKWIEKKKGCTERTCREQRVVQKTNGTGVLLEEKSGSTLRRTPRRRLFHVLKKKKKTK